MTVEQFTAIHIIFQKIFYLTLTLKTTSKINTKGKYCQGLERVLIVIEQNLLEKFLEGCL